MTDFSFSPFDDGLLVTGSQDQTIKLWRLQSDGLTSDLTTPVLELPEQSRRVETVTWHPTADCLLASSSGLGVALWDCVSGDQVCSDWSTHLILSSDWLIFSLSLAPLFRGVIGIDSVDTAFAVNNCDLNNVTNCRLF